MENPMQTDAVTKERAWRTHEELPLNRENFEALCRFDLPCLRITGFATDAECDELVAAMDAVQRESFCRAGAGVGAQRQVTTAGQSRAGGLDTPGLAVTLSWVFLESGSLSPR